MCRLRLSLGIFRRMGPEACLLTNAQHRPQLFFLRTESLGELHQDESIVSVRQLDSGRT